MLKHLTLISLALVLKSQAAVVINEIHYNPNPSSDATNEFIELHNPGATSVDISGWSIDDQVELGHNAVTHVFAPGTVIPAGGYLVLGINNTALEAFYGITGVIDWAAGELDNGDDPVILRDAALEMVDFVFYDDGDTGWPVAADGAGPSLELINPGLDNSVATNWLASSVNDGTPGAQNSVYAADALPVLAGMGHSPLSPTTADMVTFTVTATDDNAISSVTLSYTAGGPVQSVAMADQGGGVYSVQVGPFAEGTLVEASIEALDDANQSVVFPAVIGPDAYHVFVTDTPFDDSDIIVTEIQYTDACFGGLDWFELYNNTASPVDLSFWTMRDDQEDHIFRFPAGTLIGAGEYLVVAQSVAQITANYGITNVVGDVEDGLSSGGDAVRIYDVNNALVDQVYYGITSPWPGAPVGTGPSLSLTDIGLDNNQGVNWEPSQAPCGTPGSANNLDTFPPLVTSAGILNPTTVRVSFNEDIDGTTGLAVANYTLDGNPAVSATGVNSTTVDLDFGVVFAQGTLYALGISHVEDLAGNVLDTVSFTLSYYQPGAIVINEVMQNPLAVIDENGEWLELYNPNNFTVNLRGWVLTDDGTDNHTISPDADLLVAPGAFLVLGRSTDTGINGNTPVDYAYGTEYTLGNGDDEIVLLSGLYEIDRINYDNGATFPDPNGYSMELIAPALDNFQGANWQTALASATYGAGDRGTPGAVNSVSTLEAPLVSIVYAGGQAQLGWSAVDTATSYRIEAAAGLGQAFAPVATVSGTSYSVVINPLQPVQVFRVIALR